MDLPEIEIASHPLLDAGLFVTRFPSELGELSAAAIFSELFKLETNAPFQSNDRIKSSVRDLFRHSGFKPTGRNKPASEYLIKAASEDRLSSINPAVDFCNIVSLHCGLPISVVDLEKTDGLLVIQPAPQDTSYVFNVSGQEIQVDGLICLFDEQGACANAVKDSQRTKTSDTTTQTLNIIWGTNELPEYCGQAQQWYQKLLQDFGAEILEVSPITR